MYGQSLSFFPKAAVINLTKVMGKDYATLGKAMGKEAFLRKELLRKRFC